MATPIGNLEDVTLRAVRILKEVHMIAAEDTRRTKKLLRAYDIQTPLTSLYDQNERWKSTFLIAKLKEGLDVAYVSDAGTPGISDPGYILIRRAIENNIRIIPVPGVSAVIAALSVSGLPMDAFIFYGFLPSKPGKRKEFLESIECEQKTVVFYESPRRLLATLQEMESVFGDRDIVVSREMTKVFEEVLRGSIPQVLAKLQGRGIKGEVTLVVAGKEKILTDYSDEEICDRFELLRKDADLSRRDIIAKLATEMGMPKKKVYRVINILFP
ncbi:MAG: 16S rRNA (cytidine(1402)-2'-O)-methyltransferase [Deltaproteobacteria bacterium]|nr:16S rRNA (cytidine(1402)-2'-O)-methyltransferase [Deltaproteobacteria bacterium]